MTHPYHEAISLIERLHRHFLEVVKTELDRLAIEDINNVQALILFNIGKEEVTVGELTNRGYYLGSNVSYNVKKMVEHGYLEHERSTHDRRSIRVKLSEQGLTLYGQMNEMFEQHISTIEVGPIDESDLTAANDTLRALERFWTTIMTYGLQAPAPSSDVGASAA